MTNRAPISGRTGPIQAHDPHREKQRDERFSPSPRTRMRLHSVVEDGILAAITVLTLYIFLIHLEHSLLPAPKQYTEGPLLDQIMRMRRGEPLYPHVSDRLPISVSNYPPGLHLIALPLFSLFGPSIVQIGRAHV